MLIFLEQTALDIAIKHLRAHCVTLLRLAMHAEMENPGNALEDESFAMALRGFSEEVELMMLPQQPEMKKEMELPAASAPMPAKVRPPVAPRTANSPEKVVSSLKTTQKLANQPSISKLQIPSLFTNTSATVPPPTPPKDPSTPNIAHKPPPDSTSPHFAQQFQPKQAKQEKEGDDHKLPLLLSPRSKRTKQPKKKLASTASLSSAKVKKN